MDMSQAAHLLEQKRQASQAERERIASEQAQRVTVDQPARPVADLMPQDMVTVPTPSHSYRPVTMEEAVGYFQLPRLDELTTDHMSQRQARDFGGLLDAVRRWRGLAQLEPGLSFLIMSKEVGIGKTHIARAVASSFSSITGDLAFDDKGPLFALEQSARVYTARELIGYLGGDESKPLYEIVPPHIRCLVIDDLGREGYLDFVKAAEQSAEKQARYFHLFNHIYERRYRPDRAVSLFITTNLLEHEVKALLGEANWDRLLELCPSGYMQEISGLESYRRIKSGR